MTRMLKAVLLVALACLLAARQVSAGQLDIPAPPNSVLFGARVAALPNGNIVVTDPGHPDRGAVYLYSPTGQQISKLTGGPLASFGNLDSFEITVLTNGNYVIRNAGWNNADGATTWGNSKTGVSGVISEANSLLGSGGFYVTGISTVLALANGNYVVVSPFLLNGNTTTAITWANGTTGLAGHVSTANSIYRSALYEGGLSMQNITALTNGSFVIRAPDIFGGLGAIRWVNGETGDVGDYTLQNSLVGARPNETQLQQVHALENGNYVVTTPNWSNGQAANAGAATWCSGSAGCVGVIGSHNSLVGTKDGNYVGSPGVVALKNGNYVVLSADWEDLNHNDQGAVTWGDGENGTTGVVSANNSVVGPRSETYVGNTVFYAYKGVVPLENGHYVVNNIYWGDDTLTHAGAVRWLDGTKPSSGFIERNNSLVGTVSGQMIGSSSIVPLTNGHYVIQGAYASSPGVAVGAITWADGTKTTSGIVSPANSVTGTTGQDGPLTIGALPDGNFAITASQYVKDGIISAGAVKWVDGWQPSSGVLWKFNAMTGTSESDHYAGIAALSDSTFLAVAPAWNGAVRDVGAVTWLEGRTTPVGAASPSNSLVGTRIGDSIARDGVRALPDGYYILVSQDWSLSNEVYRSGAVTLGRSGPLAGPITAANGVLGTAAAGGNFYPGIFFDYDESRRRLVVGRPASQVVSLFTPDDDLVFTSGFEKRTTACDFGNWSCGRR